ncbi:hypothetical protein PENNAL_c0581G07361, partial [Penicillium nalgiovense]
DRNARICYGCIQVVESLAVDFFAGSIASSAHRSRSAFEFFDRFPYYAIMYYGAVGGATVGANEGWKPGKVVDVAEGAHYFVANG